MQLIALLHHRIIKTASKQPNMAIEYEKLKSKVEGATKQSYNSVKLLSSFCH